ncbi:hypothetical protein RIF29_14869 [Crotalaria pallida]|uniref:Uncharacterized protein n=1 Tax=Crotalaria pallida TaxID=3830 RepID=A0AAN9IIQ5_CROPI
MSRSQTLASSPQPHKGKTLIREVAMGFYLEPLSSLAAKVLKSCETGTVKLICQSKSEKNRIRSNTLS